VESFRINAMKIAGKFQSISKLKDYDEYLKMIRNHFIKIMMEEKKEKFRLEAVLQVYIGEPKTTDDHLCLKLYVMKGLDKCVKIRRAMYHRLLIENFKF